MVTIYKYQKFIDNIKTVEITFPVDKDTNQRLGEELATIDGVTYICIPDGATLPAKQPTEISKSVELVVLTPTLKSEISAASPLVRVINDFVKDTIRSKYAIEDELKLLRTSPSADFDEYNDFVEAVRAIGREKKAAIGL